MKYTTPTGAYPGEKVPWLHRKSLHLQEYQKNISYHHNFCCIFTNKLLSSIPVKLSNEKVKICPKMTKKISEKTRIWLQAQGYNPTELNQAGENGDSALMKATIEGDSAIVQELINAGADINWRNNDGNNALWFACFKNHYELINLLINSKINIDNQNDNGATVLMYTASAGKAEVLKMLLQHGANPNLENLDDFKAINFASTVEVLRLLKNAPN